MQTIADLWERNGTRKTYPGIVQTDNTCVFASLAGAINYLAGTSISESQLLGRWNANSRPQPHFGLALSYLKSELEAHKIRTTRYHDTENPLPDIEIVRDTLNVGGVIIPSVELAKKGP